MDRGCQKRRRKWI